MFFRSVWHYKERNQFLVKNYNVSVICYLIRSFNIFEPLDSSVAKVMKLLRIGLEAIGTSASDSRQGNVEECVEVQQNLIYKGT